MEERKERSGEKKMRKNNKGKEGKIYNDPSILFTTPPETTGSVYTVFLPHPALLSTSVDFLNEHIRFLEESPLLVGTERIAIPTERKEEKGKMEHKIPVVAHSERYWTKLEKTMHEIEVNQSSSSSSSSSSFFSSSPSSSSMSTEFLFEKMNIPLLSPITPEGATPLPLDFLVLDHEASRIDYCLTRASCIPLVFQQKEDPTLERDQTTTEGRRHVFPPPMGAVDGGVFSSLQLSELKDVPQPIRHLIDLLLHSPLWKTIQPHLPELYSMLNYFI